MDLTSSDVLFIGRGKDVVPWYRTGMPAFHLGCDWVGVIGEPGELLMETSLKRGGHTSPDWDAYKIIVLQYVGGPKWLKQIREWQEKGIVVIFEVDDYLHGVRKVKGHLAAKAYSAKKIRDFELCMRACDAMICSTDWLAQRYRKFNENVYVCKVCIEGTRYQRLALPQRRTVNIGFAGGVGHQEGIERWAPAIQSVLDSYPNTRFVSIGFDAAKIIDRPKQAVHIPFTSIENFPSALCNFDLAVAPAAHNNFFAAKSDLRWLETGALGIPLVADPFVYGEIEHKKTGWLAEYAGQALGGIEALVRDHELRAEIGGHARKKILSERDISVGLSQWEQVFVHAWDSRSTTGSKTPS
jgi:glycosyltransferase involved in cell wall biosynthesis